MRMKGERLRKTKTERSRVRTQSLGSMSVVHEIQKENQCQSKSKQYLANKLIVQ